MKVEHFLGIDHVSSAEELKAKLALRAANGRNEFWLEDGGDSHMAIMVTNDEACVHYFPGGRESALLAQSCDSHRDSGAQVEFSSQTPEQVVSMPQTSVVPWSAALEAAVEYFRTGECPGSLTWLAL